MPSNVPCVSPGTATAPWTTIDSNGLPRLSTPAKRWLNCSNDTAQYQQIWHPEEILWVVLRPAETEIPFALLLVTADRQRAKPSPGQERSGGTGPHAPFDHRGDRPLHRSTPPTGSFYKRERDSGSAIGTPQPRS
jgi:hypothetical protein